MAQHITVFGASGKVGQLVVAEALARGFAVTAFVHHRAALPANPRLTVIKGDIHAPKAVAEAVASSSAVISCLGSWHTVGKDILSAGMERIIPAMQAAHITRLVSLTGAGALDSRDSVSGGNRFGHMLFGLAAGKIIRDAETHIHQIRASSLEWTVLRSPIMTNWGGARYHLGTAFPRPWQTISRQAVARALVDLVEHASYVHRLPIITR